MNKSQKEKGIYNHPQLYDDIMWWKKDDVDFWIKIIEKFKSKSILELCCGTGRIGLQLINKKIDYKGIDNSAKFINFFKKKVNKEYAENISCQDIRNFNLNQKFDLIFIGFNSLAHLLSNQNFNETLDKIKIHMHSKSLFIIDMFVPHPNFLYREKNDKMNIMDFIDSNSNEKITIYESIEYDCENEINSIYWEFFNSKNKKIYDYNFKMRMYFPDTINRILIENNMDIIGFYGDYNLSYFNENSQKQIYICSIK